MVKTDNTNALILILVILILAFILYLIFTYKDTFKEKTFKEGNENKDDSEEIDETDENDDSEEIDETDENDEQIDETKNIEEYTNFPNTILGKYNKENFQIQGFSTQLYTPFQKLL
jgi:flagellar biosynthesis/type III secretory pathway M-ring protein FliF/YscJ